MTTIEFTLGCLKQDIMVPSRWANDFIKKLEAMGASQIKITKKEEL